MSTWIEEKEKEYIDWLRKKTYVHTDPQTGWSSIATPFIGQDNDRITIFAKKNGNEVLLSDDGETIGNLIMHGVNVLRKGKRKEVLEEILRSFGVSLKENELIIQSEEKNFPQAKHNLLTAILEIGDMNMLGNHTIESMFKENVKTLLEEQQLIYTPEFIMKGSTGLNFTFDYMLAGRHDEIVIKSFNSLNNNNVPNFLFTWEDVRQPRMKVSGKELKGLVIINDVETPVKSEFTNALSNKGADYILWSKRFERENIDKLSVA